MSNSTESMNYVQTNQRTVMLAKEQTEMVLKAQLQRLQEELKLKDDECAKMHEYRDRVSAELEDLTATLFEVSLLIPIFEEFQNNSLHHITGSE